MDYNELLKKVENEKLIDKIMYKFCPKSRDVEDIRQEIFLLILEKDLNFLNELYDKGIFLKYISGLIYRSLTNKGNIGKKYLKRKEIIFSDLPEEWKIDI